MDFFGSRLVAIIAHSTLENHCSSAGGSCGQERALSASVLQLLSEALRHCNNQHNKEGEKLLKLLASNATPC